MASNVDRMELFGNLSFQCQVVFLFYHKILLLLFLHAVVQHHFCCQAAGFVVQNDLRRLQFD